MNKLILPKKPLTSKQVKCSIANYTITVYHEGGGRVPTHLTETKIGCEEQAKAQRFKEEFF